MISLPVSKEVLIRVSSVLGMKRSPKLQFLCARVGDISAKAQTPRANIFPEAIIYDVAVGIVCRICVRARVSYINILAYYNYVLFACYYFKY